MPKRSSSRKPQDANRLAHTIVAEATGDDHAKQPKDPAAVALGRKGGLKGGKARAVKLSAEKRQEIASHAARARWSRPRRNPDPEADNG